MHWPQLMRKPFSWMGLSMVTVAVVFALVGAIYTPYDPLALDLDSRFAQPSPEHWLGTDKFGRDVLSRLLAAAGVSIWVSLLSALFATFLGTVIGIAAGYFGGWVDRLIAMFIDAFMAIPSILLALSIMAAIGPNRYGVVVALGISFTPGIARVVRSLSLSIREKEYIDASRAMGNSALYTMTRHVFPNCVAPLTVLATAYFGLALLTESALSFLGLGVPPPFPSWGGMLSDAVVSFAIAPWLAIAPGIAISVTLLGINLWGDALRDYFDPRMT